MRVLMLVSEAPPIKSGIARVAGELTAGLRGDDFTIDVLSANEIRRWAFKEFRISSLALHWPAIQRRLRDYDIIHVHGIVPTFSDVGLVLGRLGSRMARPAAGLVYTHHSDIDIAGLDLPVNMYNWLHHRLLRLADHVIASTPSYALHLEGSARAGRVSAVGFGVHAEQFQTSKPKPGRFSALFVGQLRPYKGVDTLLRAWQHVDNADLHIVGDGHERARLQALAAELGLQSVTFHGAVSDAQLSEFYAQAHTLILPSNRKAEAFGLVLLEGMAAGCVPISSDLPGVRDVVGNSGYTFPVGNSAELAERIMRLRDNPADLEEMGHRATARAISTRWGQTADAYAGIYRQVHLGRLLEVASHKQPVTGLVLQEWLQQVAHIANAQRASLMLATPNGRALGISASVGLPADVVRTTRLPMGHRMAGFVAHTGRSMLVRKKAPSALARLYMDNPALGSALILPLHYRGQPLGTLNLARDSAQFAFTLADQRWVERLAAQVAPLLAQADRAELGMPQLAPQPVPAFGMETERAA